MQAKKPTADKVKREEAFVLYRDMGATRSYTRLRESLRLTRHGDISVRTLSTWSTEEHWLAKLRAHDKRLEKAAAQLTSRDPTDPEFDQVDALLRTAHLALQRVLGSTPVVTKASDMKSLTDAALGALKAVELINLRTADKRPESDGRAEMFRLLNGVEQRVRRSLKRVALLETLLREKGIEVPPVEENPSRDGLPARRDEAGSEIRMVEVVEENGLEPDTDQPDKPLGASMSMAERLAKLRDRS